MIDVVIPYNTMPYDIVKPPSNCCHQLTYKVGGKTRTVYVPVDLTEEVRAWIDEYRRLKCLIQEISQLTLALVRSHVRERKRRQGRL